jgi:hypothetical protein
MIWPAAYEKVLGVFLPVLAAAGEQNFGHFLFCFKKLPFLHISGI